MAVRKRIWFTRKQQPREKWLVDYRDGEGKRRFKTFDLKKDADDYAARSHTEVIDGNHVADSASITVKEAGELWLKSAQDNNLEWTTIKQYRQHLNLHIVPFIGATKLSKLTAPVVCAFTDRLREKGRSPTLVKYVKRSLGSLLAVAQERGLTIRNPVHEVRHKRKKAEARDARGSKLKVGIDIPTLDEIRSITKAAGALSC
jgi:hypothetical protein